MNRFLSILSICLVLFPAFAHARIDVIPRKIVMDARGHGAEITILNLFNEPGTFRVDLVSMRQNEDGSYTSLEAPLDENFDPEKIVRFSPRQFTLPADGRQKIRLSLRKPADLPDGEYRFHVKALRFANQSNEEPEQGMRISMSMNVGVSIPVVVRHGELERSVARIECPRIIPVGESGKPELAATVKRIGDTSTIGSLEVLWEPAGYDEAERIGYIDNMNIFTDITQRYATLPLKYIPQGAGAIRLKYIDNGNDRTKGTVFDEVLIER